MLEGSRWAFLGGGEKEMHVVQSRRNRAGRG